VTVKVNFNVFKPFEDLIVYLGCIEGVRIGVNGWGNWMLILASKEKWWKWKGHGCCLRKSITLDNISSASPTLPRKRPHVPSIQVFHYFCVSLFAGWSTSVLSFRCLFLGGKYFKSMFCWHIKRQQLFFSYCVWKLSRERQKMRVPISASVAQKLYLSTFVLFRNLCFLFLILE
jgi:hypothetical protein